MKKYIIFFLVIFTMVTCTIADSGSFVISVINYSNKYVDNIYVGTIFIGTVNPGQVVNYKYFQSQPGAKIDIPGFEPIVSNIYKGNIDLQFNTIYKLTLYENKTYWMEGYKIGTDEKINMK